MKSALAIAALAALALPAPSRARILLIQTDHGPVWTNVPEPAGDALPSPTSRRLPYQQLIQECAQRHDVDERFVEAVIACESDFDPSAVSSAGAQGLMQLMPDTQAIYGVTDPFDAEQNVEAGTKHLDTLLTQFGGDWKLAAAAYNAGAGAVERSGGIPPFPETMHYVRKIQHYLSALGVSLGGDELENGVTLTADAGTSAPDPIMDWQPPPEPAPEPEPPRHHGPKPVIVRDSSGRVTFTNKKAAP